jgi:hypothetical protein
METLCYQLQERELDLEIEKVGRLRGDKSFTTDTL